MLIEQLDRTPWKLGQAWKRIANQLLSIPHDAAEAVGEQIVRMAPWQHGRSVQERAEEEARYELLIALGDGDLHAKGRLSTQRPAPGTRRTPGGACTRGTTATSHLNTGEAARWNGGSAR